LKIIDDIKDKIAIQFTFSGKRFKKMTQKDGWKVVGGIIERPMTHSGECLICHEHVEIKEAQKLNCCSAVYHPDCMHKALVENGTGMIDKGRCFHCRCFLGGIYGFI
jgi:hypothetical protein